ncbi:MAG TPA: malto-oligosyltrehalose synthase [Burkholderiales bacterium]|nr:malto-oligosyltrehalose synthase [Burkholderiales bacterium]
MSEERAALERLCAHFGIAREYYDIWGTRHSVSDASLRALLAEFGLDAATPERAAQAEQAAQAARWHAALPPVVAVPADSTPWALNVLRRESAATRLRWRLELEGGARQEGELDCADYSQNDRAEVGGARYVARTVAVPVALPPGYHRLLLYDGAEALGEALVVAAPARCYRPAALDDDGRVWGPAVQLYALRSERNWGMGDYGDLLRLIEQWAARGAGIVGLNPLHALFPHNPAHTSPYSPSSRLLLNVLYLEVEAIDEFLECEPAQRLVHAPTFQERLARLREAPLVDYPGVAAAKFEVLEQLYAHFRERQLRVDGPRGRAFRVFQARAGRVLRRHALFEALQEQLHTADASVWGWPVWPAAYRDPESEEVARFSVERLERVEYYEYLQWQAERQLARAAARCEALGLGVGLYLDLAVSVDRAGSEAWANRDCYATGASVGAPPDDFNLNGQDWGLPPLRPDRLRAQRHQVFVDALRANMRNAGALRIDHVMGLMRLFWIPPGMGARDGTYVAYSFEELLAIVTLESHRNRCMVIGEDLGTVPDAVREALARRGVLSYRLLYFERDAQGEFKPPADYPREALVAASTHDLPTLAGWWRGRDLEWRAELGLFPSDAMREEQIAARAQDRARLLGALEHAGLLPEGADAQAPDLGPGLADALHAYIAATPARVMTLQLEDALGALEQANLPGTVDEHPNWRRKLPVELEDMAEDARIASVALRLARARPGPGGAARRGAPAVARVPRATYRLQFNREFTFDDAIDLVPYLARLGVSDVYCSPLLRARPGSMHGYDIVDHNEINPELGGHAGFKRFTAALEARGMGLLFDVVPNHMGVLGADNAWWLDVVENGQASPYAAYFDIDWFPVNVELTGKVLLPVLGDHYGNVLASGELRLAFEPDAGSFAVRYHAHRFPLDPRSYPRVMQRAQAALAGEAAGAAAREELAALAQAFAALPGRDAAGPEALFARARDKEILKHRLRHLARQHPDVGRALVAAVAEIEAPPGDALHELLEVQAYRLAFWHVASDEINYRRFFDINELAALRMEDEAVFEATHAFVLALAAEGRISGLRIDHPDGLYDPAQYFERLQQGYARRAGIAPRAPDAGGRPPRALYVVAEKIAAHHEHVPETWAVHGTTGYRFAAVVNGLLVDGAARARIDRIWRSFSGAGADFEEVAYRGKRNIMRGGLAAELTVLATELLRLARAERRTRDYTYNGLREALAEVAACLPVYRSYIARRPSTQDRRYIDWAIAHATRRSRAADTTIFSFVRLALLGRCAPGAPRWLAERMLRFARRFQQFSAPVAAKGVEDTAFYRYNRLTSLNEVGSDPDMFGFPVSAFHGASADRAARWPHTMLATSTHDNKRSEDVRQRINVISEMPGAWRLLLRRWHSQNRGARGMLAGAPAPSRSDEYLLYQTLLGSFPAEGLDIAGLEHYRGRIERYMLKAAREAKLRTSWISADPEYEAALAGFVHALLGRLQPNPFLEDLRAQAAGVAWFGALNSLSLALIKFGSPGVPDVYQGNELLDLSLVDPDNRRPVDYALRRRLLEELREMSAQPEFARAARALAEAPHDGRAKLLVTWRMLELGRRLPELLQRGGYVGLEARGAKAAHVIAFARVHGAHTLVVIAGRLFARMLGAPGQLPLGEAAWGDTGVAAGMLAEGTVLRNVLTAEALRVEQGSLRLAQAFASFPAAALLAGPPPGAA